MEFGFEYWSEFAARWMPCNAETASLMRERGKQVRRRQPAAPADAGARGPHLSEQRELRRSAEPSKHDNTIST